MKRGKILIGWIVFWILAIVWIVYELNEDIKKPKIIIIADRILDYIFTNKEKKS